MKHSPHIHPSIPPSPIGQGSLHLHCMSVSVLPFISSHCPPPPPHPSSFDRSGLQARPQHRQMPGPAGLILASRPLRFSLFRRTLKDRSTLCVCEWQDLHWCTYTHCIYSKERERESSRLRPLASLTWKPFYGLFDSLLIHSFMLEMIALSRSHTLKALLMKSSSVW